MTAVELEHLAMANIAGVGAELPEGGGNHRGGERLPWRRGELQILGAGVLIQERHVFVIAVLEVADLKIAVGGHALHVVGGDGSVGSVLVVLGSILPLQFLEAIDEHLPVAFGAREVPAAGRKLRDERLENRAELGHQRLVLFIDRFGRLLVGVGRNRLRRQIERHVALLGTEENPFLDEHRIARTIGIGIERCKHIFNALDDGERIRGCRK